MNLRGPHFMAAVGRELPIVFVKCNWCGATAEYQWQDEHSRGKALADFRKKHECPAEAKP